VCGGTVATAAHGWVQLFGSVCRELEAAAEEILPTFLYSESINVDAVAEQTIRRDP